MFYASSLDFIGHGWIWGWFWRQSWDKLLENRVLLERERYNVYSWVNVPLFCSLLLFNCCIIFLGKKILWCELKETILYHWNISTEISKNMMTGNMIVLFVIMQNVNDQGSILKIWLGKLSLKDLKFLKGEISYFFINIVSMVFY